MISDTQNCLVWQFDVAWKLAGIHLTGVTTEECLWRPAPAGLHVCARCGAVPIVTSEIDSHTYAVVNVNVLENVDPAWLRHAPADFESESVESRLARRKRNWIPDVRVRNAGS